MLSVSYTHLDVYKRQSLVAAKTLLVESRRDESELVVRFLPSRLSSMIVNNLDVVGFIVSPLKTDSPLIVDANAILPFAVAT